MLIDQTSIHIAASKSPSYRYRVWARFEALLTFLRDKGWTDDSVVNRYASDRENFELHDSDLSSEGFEFFPQNRKIVFSITIRMFQTHTTFVKAIG